jgi:hypothetical protein
LREVILTLTFGEGLVRRVRMEGTRGKGGREEGSRSRERSPRCGKEGLGVVLLIGAVKGS